MVVVLNNTHCLAKSDYCFNQYSVSSLFQTITKLRATERVWYDLGTCSSSLVPYPLDKYLLYTHFQIRVGTHLFFLISTNIY